MARTPPCNKWRRRCSAASFEDDIELPKTDCLLSLRFLRSRGGGTAWDIRFTSLWQWALLCSRRRLHR